MADDNLVLRTFYVDDDIDEAIRVWVGGNGFSSYLFHHWLVAGMKAADDATVPKPPPPPADRPPVLRTARLETWLDSRLHIAAFDRGVAKNVIAMEYVRLGRAVTPPPKRMPSGQTWDGFFLWNPTRSLIDVFDALDDIGRGRVLDEAALEGTLAGDAAVDKTRESMDAHLTLLDRFMSLCDLLRSTETRAEAERLVERFVSNELAAR